MNHSAFKPIRNTTLPHAFRTIRLERARDPDHPEGDSKIAYTMIAPLDANDRLDAAVWMANKEACRIVRKRPDGDESFGHLIHTARGGWRLHYDVAGTTADEVGDHFSTEQFQPGEYVSIHEADGAHLYRIVSVTGL